MVLSWQIFTTTFYQVPCALESSARTQHSAWCPGGGYTISVKGLKQLLTNPVYIGWWIVAGDVISQNNHERIISEEDEHLFWFAFERLSSYTTSGEVNEQKEYKRPRRFYQRHTKDQKTALLKDRAAFPGGEVLVHIYREKPHYTLIPSYAMRPTGWKEVEAGLVDDGFLDCFFAHLKETHDFAAFQRWIEQETTKQRGVVSSIAMQLTQLEQKQESLVDERLAIRSQIRAIKDDKERAQFEAEMQPTLDTLSQKVYQLAQVKEKLLEKQEETAKNQALDTARKYATFQTELYHLVASWDEKPFKVRCEFVNLFVTRSEITLPASHFVQLVISWAHPGWGADTLYIFRKHGASPYWTQPERELIRQHYPQTAREELLRMLPEKTWDSIKKEAMGKHIKRTIATASPIPENLSWSDWQFMQEHNISYEDVCSKREVVLALYP